MAADRLLEDDESLRFHPQRLELQWFSGLPFELLGGEERLVYLMLKRTYV